MKKIVVVIVAAGMIWTTVVGCSNPESDPFQETRGEGREVGSRDTESVQPGQTSLKGDLDEYFKEVEGKLSRLKDKHAKLVERIQETGPEDKLQSMIDDTLSDLTKNGEEVQKQIQALKAAIGKDWHLLQADMNRVLEEMAQTYDKALARFPG